MPLIQSRNGYIRQPPAGARVNWANPLARRLIGLYGTNWKPKGPHANIAPYPLPLTNENDSVQSVISTYSTFGTNTGISAGTDISSLNFPSGIDTAFVNSGAASVLMLLRSAFQDSNGNAGPWNLRGWAPGNHDHYPYTDGYIYLCPLSDSRWVVGVVPTIDLTIPHIAVATHKSGDQRFYLNGQQVASHTILESPRLGPSRAGSNGAVYLIAFWDRVLSAPEVAELSRNPWQLFR